jgi:7-cyano-7-deazaguanine synthase in queuosine biosynthesis
VSVLLLSGGLDSAVCAAMTHPDQALFVDYGQPHCGHELIGAEHVASQRFSFPLYKARVTFSRSGSTKTTRRCSSPVETSSCSRLPRTSSRALAGAPHSDHRRQCRRP